MCLFPTEVPLENGNHCVELTRRTSTVYDRMRWPNLCDHRTAKFNSYINLKRIITQSRVLDLHEPTRGQLRVTAVGWSGAQQHCYSRKYGQLEYHNTHESSHQNPCSVPRAWDPPHHPNQSQNPTPSPRSARQWHGTPAQATSFDNYYCNSSFTCNVRNNLNRNVTWIRVARSRTGMRGT
jgi:hypothetical protein